MRPSSTPPVISERINKRVKYSLTRGDILRYQFYLICRHRVLISFIIIVSLGLAWNDCRTPEFAAFPIAAKILYVILLVVLMICFVGGATMATMALTVMFKKYRGVLGEHELEIRDDGLVERTDVNESVHRWAGFHKIITKRRYLYIYVTDAHAHVVPRRFFASEQAERVFRAELERHINAV